MPTYWSGCCKRCSAFRHREHIDHHNPLQCGMKKRIVMLASSFVHPHVLARLDVPACTSWTASVDLHQRQCSWWVVCWSVRLHVRVPVCGNRSREAACMCLCMCLCKCVGVLCGSCVHHMNFLCVLGYATINTSGNNATDKKLKN